MNYHKRTNHVFFPYVVQEKKAESSGEAELNEEPQGRAGRSESDPWNRPGGGVQALSQVFQKKLLQKLGRQKMDEPSKENHKSMVFAWHSRSKSSPQHELNQITHKKSNVDQENHSKRRFSFVRIDEENSFGIKNSSEVEEKDKETPNWSENQKENDGLAFFGCSEQTGFSYQERERKRRSHFSRMTPKKSDKITEEDSDTVQRIQSPQLCPKEFPSPNGTDPTTKETTKTFSKKGPGNLTLSRSLENVKEEKDEWSPIHLKEDQEGNTVDLINPESFRILLSQEQKKTSGREDELQISSGAKRHQNSFWKKSGQESSETIQNRTPEISDKMSLERSATTPIDQAEERKEVSLRAINSKIAEGLEPGSLKEINSDVTVEEIPEHFNGIYRDTSVNPFQVDDEQQNQEKEGQHGIETPKNNGRLVLEGGIRQCSSDTVKHLGSKRSLENENRESQNGTEREIIQSDQDGFQKGQGNLASENGGVDQKSNGTVRQVTEENKKSKTNEMQGSSETVRHLGEEGLLGLRMGFASHRESFRRETKQVEENDDDPKETPYEIQRTSTEPKAFLMGFEKPKNLFLKHLRNQIQGDDFYSSRVTLLTFQSDDEQEKMAESSEESSSGSVINLAKKRGTEGVDGADGVPQWARSALSYEWFGMKKKEAQNAVNEFKENLRVSIIKEAEKRYLVKTDGKPEKWKQDSLEKGISFDGLDKHGAGVKEKEENERKTEEAGNEERYREAIPMMRQFGGSEDEPHFDFYGKAAGSEKTQEKTCEENRLRVPLIRLSKGESKEEENDTMRYLNTGEKSEEDQVEKEERVQTSESEKKRKTYTKTINEAIEDVFIEKNLAKKYEQEEISRVKAEALRMLKGEGYIHSSMNTRKEGVTGLDPMLQPVDSVLCTHEPPKRLGNSYSFRKTNIIGSSRNSRVTSNSSIREIQTNSGDVLKIFIENNESGPDAHFLEQTQTQQQVASTPAFLTRLSSPSGIEPNQKTSNESERSEEMESSKENETDGSPNTVKINEDSEFDLKIKEDEYTENTKPGTQTNLDCQFHSKNFPCFSPGKSTDFGGFPCSRQSPSNQEKRHKYSDSSNLFSFIPLSSFFQKSLVGPNLTPLDLETLREREKQRPLGGVYQGGFSDLASSLSEVHTTKSQLVVNDQNKSQNPSKLPSEWFKGTQNGTKGEEKPEKAKGNSIPEKRRSLFKEIKQNTPDINVVSHEQKIKMIKKIKERRHFFSSCNPQCSKTTSNLADERQMEMNESGRTIWTPEKEKELTFECFDFQKRSEELSKEPRSITRKLNGINSGFYEVSFRRKSPQGKCLLAVDLKGGEFNGKGSPHESSGASLNLSKNKRGNQLKNTQKLGKSQSSLNLDQKYFDYLNSIDKKEGLGLKQTDKGEHPAKQLAKNNRHTASQKEIQWEPFAKSDSKTSTGLKFFLNYLNNPPQSEGRGSFEPNLLNRSNYETSKQIVKSQTPQYKESSVRTFSRRSNKPVLKSSIRQMSRSGCITKAEQNAVLEAIDSSSANHLVLGLDKRKILVGIYENHSETNELLLFYSLNRSDLPAVVRQEMVKEVYRFDSGSSDFKVLPGTRAFSYVIDAFSLKS